MCFVLIPSKKNVFIQKNYKNKINKRGTVEVTYSNYGIEQAHMLFLIIPIMLILFHYIKKGGMNRQKTPLQIYFITAALTLFFIDVVTRRVMDIMRLRKKS